MQDGVGVLNSARREPPVEHRAVHPLDIHGRELLQLHGPYGRHHIALHLAAIGPAGTLPNSPPYRSLEPPLQVLPDPLAARVKDEPPVAVCYRLCELLANLFAR